MINWITRLVSYFINREWEERKSVVHYPLYVMKGDDVHIGGDMYRMRETRSFCNVNELMEHIRTYHGESEEDK